MQVTNLPEVLIWPINYISNFVHQRTHTLCPKQGQLHSNSMAEGYGCNCPLDVQQASVRPWNQGARKLGPSHQPAQGLQNRPAGHPGPQRASLHHSCAHCLPQTATGESRSGIQGHCMTGEAVIYKLRTPETTARERTERADFSTLLPRELLLDLVSRKGLRKLLWKTSDRWLWKERGYSCKSLL